MESSSALAGSVQPSGPSAWGLRRLRECPSHILEQAHARSDWQEAGHATRNGCGTKRRESGVSMPNFAENSEPTMLRFVGHKVSITRAVKVAVRTEEPFALAG